MIRLNCPQLITAGIACTPRNDYFVAIRTAGNIGFHVDMELAVTIRATIVSNKRSITVEPTKSSVSESINEHMAGEGVFQAFPRSA